MKWSSEASLTHENLYLPAVGAGHQLARHSGEKATLEVLKGVYLGAAWLLAATAGRALADVARHLIEFYLSQERGVTQVPGVIHLTHERIRADDVASSICRALTLGVELLGGIAMASALEGAEAAAALVGPGIHCPPRHRRAF